MTHPSTTATPHHAPRRPRLLDLYCGVGGASVGYHLAGFDVTGVDIAEQPRYPYTFVRGDAIEYAAEYAHLYDFVHASPPCQDACALSKGTNKGRVYPRLIAPTRDVLTAAGVPFVIENVTGAELRRDLMLCGEMFGLNVIRHRLFEAGGGLTLDQPPHPAHRGRVAGMRHGEWFEGPYFAVYGEGGGKGTVAQWQQAMGMHWTDVRREIAEAIPPAYTHHIGARLLAHATAA